MIFFWIFEAICFVIVVTAITQIAASSSNLRSKKHPERQRPRHWWQRWEVWCRLRYGEQVMSEKECGWYPFRWQARSMAGSLEGDSGLLQLSMDSLHNGKMIWPEYEVRRLG